MVRYITHDETLQGDALFNARGAHQVLLEEADGAKSESQRPEPHGGDGAAAVPSPVSGARAGGSSMGTRRRLMGFCKVS